MKQFKLLSLLFVMMMGALTFSACGGDDNDSTGGSDNSLVGIWLVDDYELMALQADGKGYWATVSRPDPDSGDWFTWNVSGNKLTITAPDNDVDVYTYSISGDKLIFYKEGSKKHGADNPHIGVRYSK